MSFRRDAFLAVGGEDTNFEAGGPGEDWEFGERMRILAGRIANGGDCLVFHRAPSEGGSENQKPRGDDWFLETYHNHLYWMLKRPWPYKITRLPRHLYWIAKYNVPHRSVWLRPRFFFYVLPTVVRRAVMTRLRGRKPPFWPDRDVRVTRLHSVASPAPGV
jgi:hypothetical protein